MAGDLLGAPENLNIRDGGYVELTPQRACSYILGALLRLYVCVCVCVCVYIRVE